MRGLGISRLSLSVWPFAIISLGELLGAVLIMRLSSAYRSPAEMLGDAILAIAVGLIVAAVLVVVARRLVLASRSPRWRSVRVSLILYAAIAMASGLVMALILRQPDGDFSAQMVVLYTITRPINVIILALVVQQVREGVRESREVQQDVQARVDEIRRANELIESAESDLRVESRRLLASEVAAPLGEIVRAGDSLSDDELADRLDDYISTRLRPMAHVLHPVSVRLGLIPGIHGLNDGLIVDASPTVERMDSDGTLLDDDVRLQVYRWLRESLSMPGASRAALIMGVRELEISVYPPTAAPIDAVQAAAGLRQVRRGVITAPLRGQSAAISWTASEASDSGPQTSRRLRYRIRDLITVPYPRRMFLVTLLVIGAAPFQFVLYRWSLSVGSLVAVVSLAVSALLVAALLERLPRPRPTVAGGFRVVVEWLAIATAAALGLAIPGLIFDILPQGPGEVGLAIFRMSYRFTIPGLLVVLSYGLLVNARRQLTLANGALEVEQLRRVRILAESQLVDRDVAEALHRTVQGRLAAAVVMLRLGQRSDAWVQVVEMAKVEVPGLLGRLSEAGSEGLLAIDAPIGLRVVQVGDVDMSADMRADVQRALGEVAVNARRHGGASMLIVYAECEDAVCTFICEDDGTGPGDSARPGLGSRLLDDTTSRYAGRWVMEPANPGCRVVLELPVPVSERGLASSVA